MTAMDEGTALVLVALITAILAPTWLSWWNSRKHRRALDEINDAVNHRHQKPDGSPRLYDAVLDLYGAMREMVTWKERWDNLPSDIASDEGLKNRFDRIDDALDQNTKDHKRIFRHLEIPDRQDKAS